MSSRELSDNFIELPGQVGNHYLINLNEVAIVCSAGNPPRAREVILKNGHKVYPSSEAETYPLLRDSIARKAGVVAWVEPTEVVVLPVKIT